MTTGNSALLARSNCMERKHPLYHVEPLRHGDAPQHGL